MAESPGDGATCYMSDRTSAPTRIVTSSGTGTEGTRCGRPQRNTRDDVPGSDDVTTLRPQDASVVPVSRSRRRVPSKRPRPDRAHVAPFFCRAVPSASDHPEIPGGTPQRGYPSARPSSRRNSPTVEGGSACSWARRRARRSRRAFAGERMRCAVSVSDASSSALIRATSSPPGRRMSTGCRVEATSSHSAASVMRASSQVVTCVARIKPSSVPNTAGLHHGVVRRPCPATRNPSPETVRERRKDGHASTRRRSGVISIVAPPSIHILHRGRRRDRAVSSIRDAVLRIAYTTLEAGGRHG